jgi:hypothetical protein
VTNNGVEICDGLDNNCNGQVDEGSPGAGQNCNPPLASQPSRWDLGTCRHGTTACTNGNLVCNGYVGPTTEVCDGMDNDCNGIIDDPFNKQSDPSNCGSCGHRCSADFTTGSPHATPGCVSGVCAIAACDAGYYNLDNSYGNGCEYACPSGTPGTPEVCDGIDNDCDGLVDGADSHFCNSAADCPQQALGETCDVVSHRCSFDLQPIANFCAQLGACAGSRPVCTSGSWVCNYGPNVQTTGPNQIIGNETKCDGIDNDCDGCIDESFPQVGLRPDPVGGTCAATPAQACTDSGIGACQGRGTFACNTAGTGVTCNITQAGATPQNEVCDGIDNDCDGLVDEAWDDDPRLVTTQNQRCGGSPCLGVRNATVTVSVSGSNVGVARFESSRPDADRPTSCTSNSQCTGGTQCNTFAHACEKPCTGNNDCPSGVCVTGNTSNFCLPAQGLVSATACTSGASCASGVCLRLFGAASCVSTSGQPLCFCQPAAGTESPRACMVAGAEPWSSITWEQAQFACQLAGMRLCKVSRNGTGAVTADEWGAACAPAGQSYPYGASYNAGTCNGHDFDADSLVSGNQDQPVPTGALLSCTMTAGTGALDMSGNLSEWTDDFRTTLTDGTSRSVYTLRGGGYDQIATGLACGYFERVAPEDFAFPNTGFRCCASACAAGQADCGGGSPCKNLANDVANCGFCGRACTGAQTCCNGRCQATCP